MYLLLKACAVCACRCLSMHVSTEVKLNTKCNYIQYYVLLFTFEHCPTKHPVYQYMSHKFVCNAICYDYVLYISIIYRNLKGLDFEMFNTKISV